MLRCLAGHVKSNPPWTLSALWAPFCSCWFLPLSGCAEPRVARCVQTLGWPMSTRAPWLESLCFPGYHLGFRKHSFMVAGLLPEGPIVINQSTSNTAHCASCRPTVMGQQVGRDWLPVSACKKQKCIVVDILPLCWVLAALSVFSASVEMCFFPLHSSRLEPLHSKRKSDRLDGTFPKSFWFISEMPLVKSPLTLFGKGRKNLPDDWFSDHSIPRKQIRLTSRLSR